MFLNKIFSRKKKSKNNPDHISGKISYSQSGEDLIVDFILNAMGITNPVYLDIGASDPLILNNTYYFYKNNCNGVCIEANPALVNFYSCLRPKDIVLNLGVSGNTSGVVPFYVMNQNTLSTFSKEEMERLVAFESGIVLTTEKIELVKISDVLKNYFPQRLLDFVSIDVEGLDLEIVENFDFNFVKPSVFCIETLEYKAIGHQRKNKAIIESMGERGYMLYADTYINSIFVEESKWFQRR